MNPFDHCLQQLSLALPEPVRKRGRPPVLPEQTRLVIIRLLKNKAGTHREIAEQVGVERWHVDNINRLYMKEL